MRIASELVEFYYFLLYWGRAREGSLAFFPVILQQAVSVPATQNALSTAAFFSTLYSSSNGGSDFVAVPSSEEPAVALELKADVSIFTPKEPKSAFLYLTFKEPKLTAAHYCATEPSTVG